MAHSHWHGCAGFRRVSALAAKQKWKHCSPSWQTPQKVTDITIAFLSLTVIPSLFFWRFRDQVCSCSCHLWHMYKAWEYTECVFVCLKYFFCVRVCAGCPTDKITFHCFLYSTNFILFLFFYKYSTCKTQWVKKPKGLLWSGVSVKQQHTGDNLTSDPNTLWNEQTTWPELTTIRASLQLPMSKIESEGGSTKRTSWKKRREFQIGKRVKRQL